MKVYKIDLNVANSSYKRWEDTLTQSSGAEKFVVFFSVVLTLMNYTRSTSGIVSKEAKSVLILDNPFGKITSAHLLKPIPDIRVVVNYLISETVKAWQFLYRMLNRRISIIAQVRKRFMKP